MLLLWTPICGKWYIEKNGDIDISMRARFTTIEITTPSAPPRERGEVSGPLLAYGGHCHSQLHVHKHMQIRVMAALRLIRSLNI